MSLQLDSLAYSNKLRYIPPSSKVIFSLVNLAIAFFSHPPIQVIIAVWIGFCVVFYARISMKIYLKLLMVASIFMLMSLPALIINIVSVKAWLNVQDDAWEGFVWGESYLYISWQGLQQALTIFSRSFASISCLYFMILSTPFTDMLQVLRKWGLPILLNELLLLMYRFIFLLLKIANQLWISQNSRGGYRTWQRAIKSFALLVGQLLQRSLQEYKNFSQGLESRGFQGEFIVSSFDCDMPLALSSGYRIYNSIVNQHVYKRYFWTAIISWIVLLCLEIFYICLFNGNLMET